MLIDKLKRIVVQLFAWSLVIAVFLLVWYCDHVRFVY